MKNAWLLRRIHTANVCVNQYIHMHMCSYVKFSMFTEVPGSLYVRLHDGLWFRSDWLSVSVQFKRFMLPRNRWTKAAVRISYFIIGDKHTITHLSTFLAKANLNNFNLDANNFMKGKIYLITCQFSASDNIWVECTGDFPSFCRLNS